MDAVGTDPVGTDAVRLEPVGVFDSGVGGLTVLRALRAALPAEDFIYLGDTARLPYGTKSAATVVRYALQCADALVSRGIRALVVACNTASASALEPLRLRYPGLPVTGVIDAGARAAVAASRSQYIAVIGTEGTIAGGAYQSAIQRVNPGARVLAQPCPLFVAMAEEGWTTGPIAEAVARRYLEPLFAGDRGVTAETGAGPDTLVLGCTHFPVLADAIRRAVPAGVRIVDSAETTAALVAQQLSTQNAPHGKPGAVRWLATDGAARFARASRTFLGEALPVAEVEIIDL